MAIFGNIDEIDQSNYLIPGFLPDGENLLLPVGTKIAHDGKNWALYVNENLGYSWIATKAQYQNIPGWRIRFLMYIPTIQWTRDYIKSCGQCLEGK